MRLYWGKMSPFARKVTLTAHETGLFDQIVLEPVTVSMSLANPDVQEANPLSKVPTLLLDDGSALYDSRTICEYLCSRGSPNRLFPEGEERWDCLRRQSLGDGIMDALLLWRQERLKPVERQTGEWLTAFAAKLSSALAHLDDEAGKMASLPLDIGHISIACALTYLDMRFEDMDWRGDAPRLASWHAEFERLPSAVATHPFNLP